jgi:hypothetical protein
MDELQTLQSMGLVLPGPWYLFGSLLFSVIGYVVYRRGKHAAFTKLKWTGIVLMLYPYVISETWLLYGCGAGLCVVAYIYWKQL